MSAAVPQLRFPGFVGEWEHAKLRDLGSFRSGSGFPEAEQGGTSGVPFFKVSDMNLESNYNVMSVANNYVDEEQVRRMRLKPITAKSIIFAKVGAAIALERKRVAENFLIDNNMMAFTPSVSGISFEYCLAVLRNTALSAFAQVGALPSYNASDLGIIPVPLPSLAEQQKIADFLGTVDAKLDALRQKKTGLEAFKSGLMQRLFSQELRFTRDDGSEFPEWEEKTLAEIGERSKDKNKDLEINRVLTNSATQGIIDQGDYFDKDIANAESLSGYYIARFGDYVYNPRISVSAPVGPINRNNLADGVMSPLYTVFRIKDGASDFFAHYFSSNFWHDYMKGIANYGARHDRMAISMADFMAMPLPWPHPEEQRKIADALSAMDAKIASVANQITYMESFKKGLLQRMFV